MNEEEPVMLHENPNLYEWGSIRLYSGKKFNYLDPKPDTYTIRDIAEGLAKICRFGGHIDTFYSVAQHSVLMSQQFEDRRLQRWALLHDASEALMGADCPAPLKNLIPRWREIESGIHTSIRNKFNLGPKPPEIKIADHRMYATEREQIGGGGYTGEYEPYPITIRPRHWTRAREDFIGRFMDLFPMYGSTNPNAKLNYFQALEIKRALRNNTVRQVADLKGLPKSTVGDIRSGKTWSHVIV